MSSLHFRDLRALFSSGGRLEEGGFAIARILAIFLHATEAASPSTLKRPISAEATKSWTGIFDGARAKFRPFFNTSD